jgi:hypothetical protein
LDPAKSSNLGIYPALLCRLLLLLERKRERERERDRATDCLAESEREKEREREREKGTTPNATLIAGYAGSCCC